MGTQQFSLRWNNYLRHITGAFDSLRTDSDLVDVTLSCEGKKIKAHKMLLSACSSYFKDLFKDNPCQHPVIIFRNVKFDDLDALVNFMYQGEVNVLQDQLASFLTTAELLEVQGLTDGGNNPEEEEEPETEQPPPPPVQHREFRPEKRRSVPQSNNQTMSPVSFIPINKRPESPPQKRRKFVSSTSSVQSGDKDLESRRPMQQQQHPSPDPVEVIPVVPNVKVEKPDYYDGDQGGGDYSDNLHTSNSNQELPEMLEHGQIESKQEAVDIYEDSDSSHVEGLSDLNQILNKPGTSVESVSQESLHDADRAFVEYTIELLHNYSRTKRGESAADRKKRAKLEKDRMSHTLQEPCNNCRKRCTERISEEQRELINEAFWSLPTEEERRYFVFHSCERISIKRRRSRLMLPIRKEKTIKYFFCNEDGQKVEVCMVFYLTTLGYNRKNDSIIRNTFLTPEGNLKPKPSMRGKASPANKIPRDVIKAHIERFLPREEDGTLTKCLPPEMKITAMFAHFKRIHPEHEKISYELYRRVIREEKISYSTASHEIGEPEGFYGHQEYQDDEDLVTCEPILYLV